MQIAGHVVVDDRAVIGGCLGIHQFVHIGYLAMVGGMTRVDRDVPPYCLAEGHPGRMRGLNKVGIKRIDPQFELDVIGDIRATGDVIARRYVISSSVSHITSSFSSGSTIFGDTPTDTHRFTGSLDISGSVDNATPTSEVLINFFWSIAGTFIALLELSIKLVIA